MNLPLVIREYVLKMLNEANVGMKALILDDFTMNVVSAAFTQTELLQREVFLVEKLHVSPDKKMQHLKAVCFVRPTHENVSLARGARAQSFSLSHGTRTLPAVVS